MYINGEETSGYTEKDFENYRKKYIGNIFQNFNLVNSYTVYQNIELVLLINGYKKHKVKKQILNVIDKVGLLKYKNTKVSKLSGGQKQRVAIARALIKETPIIVADEPTGNLDSKTAENIMELLNEVSKDKLVIVVTHNYEQVEKYATRKIVMHDGKIIEDKKLIKKEKKNTDNVTSTLSDILNSQNKKKNISELNKFRLGIRNTFNIKIKFLLLLAVFLFMATATFAEYASFKKQEYDQSNLGYSNFFQTISDKRIIIQKNDLSQILDSDYEKIKQNSNTDYIVQNDLLLDIGVSISTESFGLYGNIKNISMFNSKLVYGEMPKNDNEIVVLGRTYDYFLANMPESVIGLECTVRGESMYLTDGKVKIVGIAYMTEEEESNNSNTCFYVPSNLLEEIQKNINVNYSSTKTEFNDKILSSQLYMMQYKIVPNSNVPAGKAYVSEELNYMTKYNNCKNYDMKINVENMYYKDILNVKILKTYNKKSLKSLTGIEDFDLYSGAIFVNSEEYYNLFNKGNFQSSVFIKNEKEKDATIQYLKDSGFKTLYVKDCLQSQLGGYGVITKLVNIGFLVMVAIALLFISYFIIKIILKSRNVYFSTIRILGATRKNAKSLLRIELFAVMNLAYACVIALIALIKNNVIINNYLQSMITYLELKDYIIAYILLSLISILISNRYSKKLFKKSAMNTYRDEEV